jgi:type IV secretion system protein VirB9
MRLRCALLLWALAAGPAAGEILPQPGPVDRRIQSVVYNAEDVVRLRVALGYQVSLQFAPDERIESAAVGDSASWQVTPNKRGDLIFVKLVQPVGITDLVVATDARTYTFVLEPVTVPADDLPFVVRFHYPSEVARAIDGPGAAGRYTLRGDRALRPDSIGDDGTTTRIAWRRDQPLPAVFAVEPDGTESLLNGMMRDGALTIEGISRHLVFRLNKRSAEAERTTAPLDR